MSMYPTREERRDVRRTGFWTARWVAVVVVAVVIFVGIIGLAWHRYYGRASLDIDARNRRASFERQDTDRAELLKLYDQYTATDPADTAHRAALIERMCGVHGEVRGSLGQYPSLVSALNDNC